VIGRVLAVVALLVAVGAVVVLVAGGSDDRPRYEFEFDNAFGLTENTELRVAGVEVGTVETLEIDPRTARALVTVRIDDPAFGDFREDVECAINPQSLIGEYYVDCEPGEGDRKLEDGARVPVEQTRTTIPPDMVVNVMRRPERERFGIILAELGAGLTARGPDINESIRRAIPALRETDKVLAILADNRERLRRLTRDGDTVMTALAERRDDVARFVTEARDVSRLTASRRADLQENVRLLPSFLRELRPVLEDLGTTVRRPTPALRDLRAASDDLQLVFERLGPFSRASLPALRSLGEASETGIGAMRSVRPMARRLRVLGRAAGDPLRNLRFVLEHVDDRDNAINNNPASPGGRGYTGLEAFLQYPFVQSQAINVFDARGYLLKINLLVSPCTQYRDAESVREDPELREQCSADLGPGPKYGIDFAFEERDANASSSGTRRTARSSAAPERQSRSSSPESEQEPVTAPAPADAAPQSSAAPAPDGARAADPDSDALLDFLFGS
jgi:virulence factor Mce-like protein